CAGTHRRGHRQPTWTTPGRTPHARRFPAREQAVQRYRWCCIRPGPLPQWMPPPGNPSGCFWIPASGVLPDAQVRQFQFQDTASALLALSPGGQIGFPGTILVAYGQQDIPPKFGENGIEGIRFAGTIKRGQGIVVVAGSKLGPSQAVAHDQGKRLVISSLVQRPAQRFYCSGW